MSDREAVEFPHPALLQLILFVIGVGGQCPLRSGRLARHLAGRASDPRRDRDVRGQHDSLSRTEPGPRWVSAPRRAMSQNASPDTRPALSPL